MKNTPKKLIKVREKFQVTLPQELQQQIKPGEYLACETLEDGSIRLAPAIIELKSGGIVTPSVHGKKVEEQAKRAERQLARKPGPVFRTVEEMNEAILKRKRDKD